MSQCSSCDNTGKVLQCDGCKDDLCSQWAELSPTEMRCMELKRRKLIFLCSTCERGLKQIPLLIKKINELDKQINEIKDAKVNTKVNLSSDEEFIAANNERLVTEIFERQKRATNVMMINIKEQSGVTNAERNLKDKNAVKDVLKDINVDMSNISVFRVGRYNQEKNRPLKIIFPSSHEALQVLKNKQLIQTDGVKIFGDQTKIQREYYMKLKEKVKAINENGGNKTIKYINNVPTIVEVKNGAKN